VAACGVHEVECCQLRVVDEAGLGREPTADPAVRVVEEPLVVGEPWRPEAGGVECGPEAGDVVGVDHLERNPHDLEVVEECPPVEARWLYEEHPDPVEPGLGSAVPRRGEPQVVRPPFPPVPGLPGSGDARKGRVAEPDDGRAGAGGAAADGVSLVDHQGREAGTLRLKRDRRPHHSGADDHDVRHRVDAFGLSLTLPSTLPLTGCRVPGAGCRRTGGQADRRTGFGTGPYNCHPDVPLARMVDVPSVQADQILQIVGPVQVPGRWSVNPRSSDNRE